MTIMQVTYRHSRRALMITGALVAITTTTAQPAHAQEAYVNGFKAMTMELSAFATHYLVGLGKMFDAKAQLETEQKYRELNAQAHKDYHPSDTMCRFGSFVRSVARTEESARTNKHILDQSLINIALGKKGSANAEGSESYHQSRLKQFKSTYCNVADNNGGLNLMCETQTNPQPERANKDIDYSSTLGSKLTVDVNYLDPEVAPDEQDIYALAQHLYWAQPVGTVLADKANRYKGVYQNHRRLTAMQSVAHNSFTNIVAMKSAAEQGVGAQSGWSFMKSLMREFGMSDSHINENLGNFPSYYAQMDVLTKKIYQSPSFYTNLYDKPANVRRISASMEAIKLMQGRDQYESSLRREMLLSMMIEQELADDFKDVSELLKE